jgi:hypothetical protein
VTVSDKISKDRAYSFPSITDLIILRKDYLMKVPGVPLSTQITGDKDADNIGLAESIYIGLKRLTSGLQIIQIR